MGYVGGTAVRVDDNLDVVRTKGVGAALIAVSRTDADGRTVRAVASLNTQAAPVVARNVPVNEDEFADEREPQSADNSEPFVVEPDVYPGTLTLVPSGTRQLKVQMFGSGSGAASSIAGSPATRYFSSDESVATVSAGGRITALREGRVIISVVHLGSQIEALYDDHLCGHHRATRCAFRWQYKRRAYLWRRRQR
jgi:hypothetical protein